MVRPEKLTLYWQKIFFLSPPSADIYKLVSIYESLTNIVEMIFNTNPAIVLSENTITLIMGRG